MKKGVKVVIVIVIILAVLGGGAVIFGGEIVKRVSPQAYVMAASTKTFGGVSEVAQGFLTAREMSGGAWKQDISMGITGIQMDGIENEDIQAVATLLRYGISTEYDTDSRECLTSVNVKMGASNLIDTDIYFTDNLIALRVRQIFDYYIWTEPGTFVDDWNSSVIGTVVPLDDILVQTEFAEGYREFMDSIFSDYSDAGSSDITMAEGWELTYVGSETVVISGKDMKADVFDVKLKKDSVNADLSDGMEITKDIPARIYISDGEILRITFEMEAVNQETKMDISGSADFLGEKKRSEIIDFTLKATVDDPEMGRYYIDFNGTWDENSPDEENCSIVMNVSDRDGLDVELDMIGSINIDTDDKKIDIDIDRAVMSLKGDTNAEITMNMKYTLQPGVKPAYDGSDEKRLSELEMMDVLTMYGSIMDSDLGEMIAPYLEF